MPTTLQLLNWLAECDGDSIWSRDYCRQRGVPAEWIAALLDCFESNPQNLAETVFVGQRPLTQYEGVRDVDLACRIGRELRVDVEALAATAWRRRDLVVAIREAIEEG